MKTKLKLKNKLKDFAIEEKKIICDCCQQGVDIDNKSIIRITTMDSQHRYKGSKRKFLMNYKLNLCPNCYKILNKELTETIVLRVVDTISKLPNKRFKDVISKKHKTK